MMIATKQNIVFQTFCLIYLLHFSNGLQCKVCAKDDPQCLIGDNVVTRPCANDDDVCFSWFDRKGGAVGIERDCISTETSEYKAMKKLIESRNSGCVKSANSLDCFTFCPLDNCN